MSRVLLFCPTYKVDGVPQIKSMTKASIDGVIAPPNVELDKIIGMDNPYKNGGHRNTLHQYQKARELVLSESYDALLTVEHDMIVPEDALIKMWDTDAPVVYGLYRFRSAPYVVNAFDYNPGSNGLGRSLSYLPDKYAGAVKRGWTEVSGLGFGCTLIRREVLEKFELHMADSSYLGDTGLALDCLRNGIKQIARFDVNCGHILNDRYILYPSEEVNMKLKCKILLNFIGNIDGSSVAFRAGDIVDLPGNEALEYQRAGFLELIEKPAVKIVHKPKSDKAVK